MIPATPFDAYKKTWYDLSFSVPRQWRKEHPDGKIVGTFPVWVPLELIHGAGALPVTLYGSGGLLDIEYADARMQSFICSISRSTLELALRSRLDWMDGMVFPSICDVARNLSGVWQRNFPDQWVIFLHLPENIHSPHAIVYMKNELQRMREGLERLVGHRVPDEAIRSSIHIYNKNRRLLRKLYAIKSATPHAISTYELYLIARAGVMVPPEQHTRILQKALETVQSREARPRDRIRILLEGSFCEQPPLEFIWAIEEAGCYILDDDYLLGMRYFLEDISEEGDPLEAIARGYLETARPSAVRYDGRTRRTEHFIDRARNLQVDGVLFAYAKFCDPAQFDFVILKGYLEKMQIPYLTLEFEEKMTVFEQTRNQVETFVESILFYS